MKRKSTKWMALVLALVLALSLLPGAALAAEAEPANYITGVTYGTKTKNYVTIDMENPSEWYVTIPDNISSNGKIQDLYLFGDPNKYVTIYSEYSESKADILGNQYVEYHYTNQQLSTSGTKFISFSFQALADGTSKIVQLRNTLPNEGKFGPLEYYVVVGTDWDEATKRFTNVDQVIRVINRSQVTLKNLKVSQDGSELQLSNAFNTTKYNYDVVLPDFNKEVTLTATPTINHERIVASFSSGDKSLGSTFTISELEKNGNGHPYVSVQVDGKDAGGNPSKNAVPSTYTIQFLENEVEAPAVEIEGESTRYIGTGEESDTLNVTVTNKQDGEDDQYTYQWYSVTGPEVAELPSTTFGTGSYTYDKGYSIPGATSPTYHLNSKEKRDRWATYYYCDVTKTVDGTGYTTHSPTFAVAFYSTHATIPVIERQPENITVAQNAQNVFFTLLVSPVEYGGTVTAKWYRIEKDDTLQELDASFHFEGGGYGHPFMSEDLPTDEVGTYEYYCVVTNTVQETYPEAKTFISKAESLHVTLTVQSIPGAEELNGSGTVDDPYQISTIDDLKKVKSIVESGYTLEGTYLKLMNDLTLPADWDPIGALKPGSTSTLNGKNVNPFSGTFDGGGHKLTIEPGGTGIFNYVRRAEIKNLKVYGTDIRGNALVTGIFTDYGVTGQYNSDDNPWTVKIDNVTLLSGSKTSGAGFLFGSGSGINTVWITNSTVEAGCTVGSASFVNSLNGFITNCTSKATVRGSGACGGLAVRKGETMGACNIQNSSFEGTIVSGSYAGGIIGSGYGPEGYRKGNLSAPNTPVVTVNNCYVHAEITGSEMVGGIIGGEPSVLQCWGNGEGTISNNVFVGALHPTGQCDAGGIVGYIRGFDQYQFLHDNYYVADCGVNSGIGYIGTVLYAVESAKPDQAAMPDTTFQLDKTYGFTAKPEFEKYCTAVPRDKLNDLVDTLNKATKSFGNWVTSDKGPVFDATKVVPYELSIRGDYKTDYVIGEELDLSGAVITATLTDRTTKSLEWKELTVEGYDKDKRGVQTVTLSYGGASCTITVTVLKKDTGTIDVTLTLLGDAAHGPNGAVHTWQAGNLVTWIPSTSYTVDVNATVWDVLEKALKANNMTCSNPSGNYVESITYGGTKLAEFTNGTYSGWMYTLNGVHTDLGVSEQYLEDGDVIVFHYTDDYTKEDTSFVPPDTLTPSVTPNAYGEAKAEITTQAMDDAVEAARKSGADEIVIAPQVSGSAGKVTVELDKSSVDLVARRTNAGLTVLTDAGDVILPPASVAGLAARSGQKVSVSVEEASGGRRVIEVAVDGRAVTSLRGGLKAEIWAGTGGMALAVVNGGTQTVVKKSIRDRGRVAALLDGSCTVKVIDNRKDFDDVEEGAWYAGAVDFASSHELFQGVGEKTFAPEEHMDRGMLATVLWRLEDERDADVTGAFTDVADGTWYTEGVAWASEQGIVEGYGGGKFGPTDDITREQLATMLWRYAKGQGLDMTVHDSLSGFTDGGKVSDYAANAMKWAVGAGLLEGKGAGVLDPAGNATRAEVATILQRMVRLIVA